MDTGGTRSAGIDDLWQFYQEHATQVRQEQNLRAAVTSTLAGFAGVMVAFAGIGGLRHSDVPAACAVIILGGLGTLLSLAHYRKERLHVLVLSETRRAIVKEGGYPTKEVRDRAEQRHLTEYLIPKIVDQPLWKLWVFLPGLIAIVGAALLVMAVVEVH